MIMIEFKIVVMIAVMIGASSLAVMKHVSPIHYIVHLITLAVMDLNDNDDL